jgi:hypothetical protein
MQLVELKSMLLIKFRQINKQFGRVYLSVVWLVVSVERTDSFLVQYATPPYYILR